jgi:hypothetical protein
MCLDYLHWNDMPEYARARDYLLAHQNADGSWGSQQQMGLNVRLLLYTNPKYQVDVGQYQHTTQVTLEALCYPYYHEQK